MIGQATTKAEYARYSTNNINECKWLAKNKWYSNRPKLGMPKIYGIKTKPGQTIHLIEGDYIVKDIFGRIEVLSNREFMKKYTPVTMYRNLKQWEACGEPFEDSGRKVLSEGTINNLVQSSMGFSIESIARSTGGGYKNGQPTDELR